MPPKYAKKFASPPVFAKGNAEWLMIVESSSKCSKIESFLGDKYKCVASNGHFRVIDGLSAIDSKHDYSPTFSVVKDKAERMRDAIRQFPKQNIIVATDEDREGEAIAWHICDTFELSLENTQRIVFHEITGDAIVKALDNKRTVNMELVYVQFARQVLDMLVGFRISPVLWKYCNNNGLSAGRCQTPALRLVYDLAMKVTPKREETLYKVIGRFTSNNIEFTLNCELREKELYDFLTKSLSFNHILTIDVSREVTKTPPVPFNTSCLLQIASNVLRLSPKDTMALCQVLYQDGHITYMRTENTMYSREFIQTAGAYITSQYGEKFVGIIESINNNNPHEAIRVTHIESRELTETYDGKIKSLYKLIWRRTLESCMSDAKYMVTECRVSAPENKAYITKIETPMFLGFNIDKEREREREREREKERETKDTSKYLPFLKSLTSISVQSLESRIIVQSPVSYYTESGLIRKLEELGIGRPSTFASLVDVIQERKYVKRMDIEGVNLSYNEYKLIDNKVEAIATTKVVGSEKDKLVIQPIGIVIIEFLSKHFNELFSYDYTSNMEKRLDTVSRECWHNVCRECDGIISLLSQSLSKAYKIDDTHDVIFSRNGPVIRSTVDGTTKFDSIRTDITIDIDKLRNNEYELAGILQEKEIKLGEMDGHQLYIKNGRYGVYAEWGPNKQSLNSIKKTMSEITIDDISRETKPSDNILRILNADFSIRKGKYGPYAFYKTPSMHKPVFLNIKKFKESFTYCNAEVLINWLYETHNISR